jgi:hypothetical protein
MRRKKQQQEAAEQPLKDQTIDTWRNAGWGRRVIVF